MIVLEGQNNVGKSTLVDWTCAQYGILRFHHAGPEDEEAQWVRDMLARWGSSDDVAVFDRFYFTYLAYPSTGNWRWGKAPPPSVTPAFCEETEAQLREMLEKRDLLLIHAAIPIEKLWAYEVGLNPAVEEAKGDFLVLKRAFEDVLASWRTVPYDYTDPASVEAVHDLISRFVALHELAPIGG